MTFRVLVPHCIWLLPFFISPQTARVSRANLHLLCLTPLTFKRELFGDSLGFVLIQVHNGHLCTGLTQGMSECSAYALPGARHIGHLSIKTHPIEDGAALDPPENFVIRYFTLTQTEREVLL